MMRIGAVSVVIVGLLSACGHTPEERLASGLLLGAAAGAVIGVASDPNFGEHHRSKHYHEDRHYKRDKRRHYDRHHDHLGHRRHRGYDYDDYGDCCYD
ncbi:MAG: hypothetical protein AAGA73_06885 [Pseudomonadota bacterium]